MRPRCSMKTSPSVHLYFLGLAKAGDDNIIWLVHGLCHISSSGQFLEFIIEQMVKAYVRGDTY